MNNIDTDYRRPGQHPRPRTVPRKRLRRFSLLLLSLSLIIGTAWVYSTMPAPSASSNAQKPLAVAMKTVHVQIQPVSYSRPQRATATRQPPAAGQAQPAASAATASPTALRFEPSMPLAPIEALASARQGAGAAADRAARGRWIRIEIHEGDTLSSVFARHDLAYADALAIALLPDHGEQFATNLHVGDTFRIKANAQGHVLALKYPLGPARFLKIEAGPDGYTATIEHIDLNRRVAYATGIIRSSFYRDAIEAGLSPDQIMTLANLFKWEVDFGYGIQPGDRFTVVYSELYKNGHRVADGHILAASFRTGDRQVRAFRFTAYENETVYYRPDGSSLKRAFIRSPVDYIRISSPFSMARDHPILDHVVRAHEGTDYAAPMGTPIHAAGDGRITFRGWNGGYGNMVMIDHGNGITTRYGHMSRFASGQSVGTYVEQGAIIGYVGSTGLSTGPHLHYEFRINGVPKNPETVDLPGAPPLPDQYMDEFKAHIKPLIAQLETISRTMLARNEHTGVIK